MNLEYYKEYIQDSVINPLERLMGNDVGEVTVYEKYYRREGIPPKDATYRSLLHEMMLPYYVHRQIIVPNTIQLEKGIKIR